MVLNKVGQTAEKCWLDIPKHFPKCELDNYIIMPNHIHGIIKAAVFPVPFFALAKMSLPVKIMGMACS